MKQILKSIFFAAAGFLAARGVFGRRRAVHADPSTAELPPSRRDEIKRFLKRLAMLVPVFVLLGFLVAASGIIPITASSGHWGITAWFLEFSKSRSFSTHSLGIKTPPLDDSTLVLKGAGHYETGCLPCHGGPGREAPRIARQMTPVPPRLPEVVIKRAPRELFYVVKHGIKLTGMPAWPSLQRDDEVWAMVAFLLTLPDLDPEQYQALVFGELDTGDGQDAESLDPDETDFAEQQDPDETDFADQQDPDGIEAAEEQDVDTTLAESAPLQGLVYPEEIPPAVSDRCGRCHGEDGTGRGVGAFPKLAGQRSEYLFATMRAYADGDRNSGIMQPVAAGLGEEEMREIALFYSRLTSVSQIPLSDDDEAARMRGERIAFDGIPRERVPSCADCHGPGGEPKNPFYPLLAGQYADYIELQLDLFKDERRGGSPYANLMHPTADDLTADQMRDVALFYESLSTSDLE